MSVGYGDWNRVIHAHMCLLATSLRECSVRGKMFKNSDEYISQTSNYIIKMLYGILYCCKTV